MKGIHRAIVVDSFSQYLFELDKGFDILLPFIIKLKGRLFGDLNKHILYSFMQVRDADATVKVRDGPMLILLIILVSVVQMRRESVHTSEGHTGVVNSLSIG